MTLDPPRYQWTGARFEERRQPAVEPPPMVWVTCGYCGGQREVWQATPEGYVPIRCGTCLGLGEVTR